MPYAKLSITVPKMVWISDVSQNHSDVRFRVLAATANDDAGVAEMELVGPDSESICDEIRSYETVTAVTEFESEPGRHRIEVETTMPLLLSSIQASGVPLTTPFEVSDGEMLLAEHLPQERLSKLGDTLDDFGITYTVEQIQQHVDSESLLTDRQHWLIGEAIDRGYYDTPRRTTLTDLADELDIAASTCSEVLHRAEERVLKQFMQRDRPAAAATPARAD